MKRGWSFPGARALLLSLLALVPVRAVPQADALLCNEFRMTGVENAMRTRPGHDRACHALGMALIRQGGRHDSRLQEAEFIFRTLFRLRPESPFAYIGFAELRMRRRELGLRTEDPIDVIQREAERATRIRPVLPEAYVTLGRADLLAGCLPCARRSAKRALELGVDSPELAMLRSRIAELGGDPGEARAVLERAAMAPELAQQQRSSLLLAQAELEVRHGESAKADGLLAEAALAEPDNVEALIRRAEVRLFERGDLGGFLELAAASPRGAATIEIKSMRGIARYVAWSRDRLAGRKAEDLRRLSQASYVAPETAFTACARHPALTREFKLMLEAGLVPRTDIRDDRGNTALLAAAAGGNVEVARLLIARAADLEAEDRRGRRALTYAVDRSNHGLLRILLGAGATVDYVDKDERSPLMLAVQKGDGIAARLLLQYRSGRSAELPSRAGDLLSSAAILADIAVLEALLDSGIPVDTPDATGRSALVAAVFWQNRNAARLLVSRGADVSKALEAAREVGDGDLIRLLESSLKRNI